MNLKIKIKKAYKKESFYAITTRKRAGVCVFLIKI